MTKSKRNRGGRPPLPVDQKLGYRLNIYLRSSVGEELEALARKQERTVSTVVRAALEAHLFIMTRGGVR